MATNKMILESLSNELFIELFALFDVVDLFRAFYGLNTRFNSLLIHLRRYRVDFRSIFKEDFCRTYLPLIINRTIYLRFFDKEDTPYQCAHFQSAGFKFGQFDNIRYLTLENINLSLQFNQYFFSDLCHLHNLTHLKFIHCRMQGIFCDFFQDVIEQIWNLPKLTHCYFDFCFRGISHFHTPTSVSTSLQYLTILGNWWYSNKFVGLLKKTPQLRTFAVSLQTLQVDEIPSLYGFLPSFKNLSVKRLILYKVDTQRLMINLFQSLPNVNQLKVEIFSIKLDGNQWEQIIVNYLPQLKIFQMKMNTDLCPSTDNQRNEEKIDQFLATYRTPFWIEHDQWFIRCHWGVSMENVRMCVYSLPYKFGDSLIYENELLDKTKSTCLGV
ncbi:unnamed protein product [Adineta steineri]|uniref:F-box domain-containing protein n=1 Tax=Adineta steineri TaxID=433720 RepID=A0A819QK53_9BILA|nr:unnamed protein product [Adineta steineri]CAF4030684.1 unnamed protein product [Adineta steineri]